MNPSFSRLRDGFLREGLPMALALWIATMFVSKARAHEPPDFRLLYPMSDMSSGMRSNYEWAFPF